MSLIVSEDNTEQFLSDYERALAVGLESVGLTCERFAKDLCPVDTGRLRNSITHSLAVDDKYVIVGTNVEYAKYVELNEKAHHESGQAHFLHDAAANHGKTYHDILESALRDA